MSKHFLQNTRQILIPHSIEVVRAFFDMSMQNSQYISFWSYVGNTFSKGKDHYEVFFDYDPDVHPFYKFRWNRMRPSIRITLQSAEQGTMVCFTNTSALKCIHMLPAYAVFTSFGIYAAIQGTGRDRWILLLLTHMIIPAFCIVLLLQFHGMCRSVISGLKLWMKDQNK